MKAPHVLCLLLAATVLASPGLARPKSLTVSVSGEVARDYQRTRLPDGGFKPEQYVIANGDKFPGTTRDSSFDKVSYPELAGVVARHLASQKYFLAKKAADADLLVVIYWGATIPFNDVNYGRAIDNLATVVQRAEPRASVADQMLGRVAAQDPKFSEANSDVEFGVATVEMENRHRDLLNARNARILGYMDAINNRRDMLAWADVGSVEQDLISDVEEERYYVVVSAYDFPEMRRSGKKVLRWTTRISIGARGTSFDERMQQMVASAASAFGQGQGLHRRFYGDPRVDLGELQFLGEASAPSPANREK